MPIVPVITTLRASGDGAEFVHIVDGVIENANSIKGVVIRDNIFAGVPDDRAFSATYTHSGADATTLDLQNVTGISNTDVIVLNSLTISRSGVNLTFTQDGANNQEIDFDPTTISAGDVLTISGRIFRGPSMTSTSNAADRLTANRNFYEEANVSVRPSNFTATMTYQGYTFVLLKNAPGGGFSQLDLDLLNNNINSGINATGNNLVTVNAVVEAIITG